MVSQDGETPLEGAVSCAAGPAGAEVSWRGPDLYPGLLRFLTHGWEGTTCGRNRNQSRSPAGPSLRTSEPEDVFLVSCRLPEAHRVGTGFLHCRVQRPAGRFGPCQLGGDVPRVWAVLVQS